MSVLQLNPPAVRLHPTAVARPALSSHVRPALVLPERQTRALLESASREDVGRGGAFSAGPAGIQLWTGPFNGAGGSKGDALLLGSVDWSYDTPSRHYATIYRAMVTQDGLDRGETTASVLARVLALTGLAVDGDRLSLAQPPPRDPFHRGS